MAWTAPMTASLNATFTAAQFNSNIRDNLLETLPGKATGAANGWFVSTAANTMTRRAINYANTNIASQVTRLATTYGDPTTGGAGPTVTLTTGTSALVLMSGWLWNNTINEAAYMSFAVSGASTIAATDKMVFDGIAANVNGSRSWAQVVTLTGGSNTFTAQYKSAAIGAGHEALFQNTRLHVIPLN